MKQLLAFFLAGFLLSGMHAAAVLPPSTDDLPQVRPDGHRLMFGWHGGSPHRVDVSNLIRAVTLDTARVLLACRSGDFDYFLVSVSGPSLVNQSGSSNPSGTESNLLWLKLKAWKLLDAQSMLYQSFRDARDPIGDYHLIGGVLTLRYTDKRENTDYVLRYDASRPDGKISLERAGDVE